MQSHCQSEEYQKWKFQVGRKKLVEMAEDIMNDMTFTQWLRKLAGMSQDSSKLDLYFQKCFLQKYYMSVKC